jgi:hypothetical protein
VTTVKLFSNSKLALFWWCGNRVLRFLSSLTKKREIRIRGCCHYSGSRCIDSFSRTNGVIQPQIGCIWQVYSRGCEYVMYRPLRFCCQFQPTEKEQQRSARRVPLRMQDCH